MPRTRKLTIDQILSEAKKATSQGKTATAIQLYQTILRSQPNHAVAKKCLQKLLQQEPPGKEPSSQTVNPSPDQISRLAHLYQSGKFTEVEQSCRQLLQKHLQSENLLNILGATLRMLGRLEEALESYNKALQLKPDFAEAYNNRGNTLQKLGRSNDALDSFDKALQLKPDFAEAHNNRGLALRELGRMQEALDSFDNAL